ncbi:MAG: hypothetical protein DRP74_02180 [Candidatus Omnitrophota bacterium]|nr:MAG: hypothetical protein DRP74_02180 [Candidatus Omnitrophota bacterium]
MLNFAEVKIMKSLLGNAKNMPKTYRAGRWCKYSGCITILCRTNGMKVCNAHAAEWREMGYVLYPSHKEIIG